MADRKNPLRIPLLSPGRLESATLHVIALAQSALACTGSWAANCQVARLQLKAENDQLRRHVALLSEEIRIKAGIR